MTTLCVLRLFKDVTCDYISSSLLSELPTPTFCVDWITLNACKRKQLCCVTAKVAICNDTRCATETSPACRIVILRDKHGSERVCTVFPPCCYSNLWQHDAILNIFGCMYDACYKSFKVTASSCILQSEYFTWWIKGTTTQVCLFGIPCATYMRHVSHFIKTASYDSLALLRDTQNCECISNCVSCIIHVFMM